jgi:hypothetical protein
MSSRINESGLKKKVEKVMNWGVKSEAKGTRTIQYLVKLKVSKELEGTSGVDMILYYSHAPRL